MIVGCAMPEGEQGMNVARIGLLLAGLPDSVPGMTLNRFCASGVEAVARTADAFGWARPTRCWPPYGNHDHDPDGWQQARPQSRDIRPR